MNIIVRIKRFFRRGAGEFEVWDTSAISTWPNEFKERTYKEGVHVIVPEGVRKELSAGRRNHEVCRDTYKFINSAKAIGKVKVYVTKKKMRAWSVDDQVVAIAEIYYNKGYNVTVVTCDGNMSDNAENIGISVELLKGNKQHTNTKVIKPQTEFNTKEIYLPVGTVSTVPRANIPLGDTRELVLPCIKKGKELYVNVKTGISVYDNRGKRKIGKENLVAVSTEDLMVYRDKKYRLQTATEENVILKKIEGT